MKEIICRSGTVQGSKHMKLDINNQDAVLMSEFQVQAFKKTYRLGLVSDGCTGIPAFSNSEVGSRLLTTFSFGRIQDLICWGASIEEIPLLLFRSSADFLRNLALQVMPSNISWNYPMKFDGEQLFRNTMSATERFKIDYLSATLLGFISDGEKIVVFSAGDGVIIVNDEIEIIDQNDRPKYPVLSINDAKSGFIIKSYTQSEVERLLISTDGIEKLLQLEGFIDEIFGRPNNPLGIKATLKRHRKDHPELMEDDCTAIVFQQIDIPEPEPPKQIEEPKKEEDKKPIVEEKKGGLFSFRKKDTQK